MAFIIFFLFYKTWLKLKLKKHLSSRNGDLHKYLFPVINTAKTRMNVLYFLSFLLYKHHSIVKRFFISHRPLISGLVRVHIYLFFVQNTIPVRIYSYFILSQLYKTPYTMSPQNGELCLSGIYDIGIY